MSETLVIKHKIFKSVGGEITGEPVRTWVVEKQVDAGVSSSTHAMDQLTIEYEAEALEQLRILADNGLPEGCEHIITTTLYTEYNPMIDYMDKGNGITFKEITRDE